jgi:hypothetical protein
MQPLSCQTQDGKASGGGESQKTCQNPTDHSEFREISSNGKESPLFFKTILPESEVNGMFNFII